MFEMQGTGEILLQNRGHFGELFFIGVQKSNITKLYILKKKVLLK